MITITSFGTPLNENGERKVFNRVILKYKKEGVKAFVKRIFNLEDLPEKARELFADALHAKLLMAEKHLPSFHVFHPILSHRNRPDDYAEKTFDQKSILLEDLLMQMISDEEENPGL